MKLAIPRQPSNSQFVNQIPLAGGCPRMDTKTPKAAKSDFRHVFW
jgi:hypothetical protein